MQADIVGIWQQPAPSTVVMRLAGDGVQTVAASVAELDTAPFAEGTWELAGQTLTLTNTEGSCSGMPSQQVGVYEVEVGPTTLAFTAVDDICPERNVIDGQTWTRVE